MDFEIFHGTPYSVKTQIREWLAAHPAIQVDHTTQSDFADGICIAVFYSVDWFNDSNINLREESEVDFVGVSG